MQAHIIPKSVLLPGKLLPGTLQHKPGQPVQDFLEKLPDFYDGQGPYPAQLPAGKARELHGHLLETLNDAQSRHQLKAGTGTYGQIQPLTVESVTYALRTSAHQMAASAKEPFTRSEALARTAENGLLAAAGTAIAIAFGVATSAGFGIPLARMALDLAPYLGASVLVSTGLVYREYAKMTELPKKETLWGQDMPSQSLANEEIADYLQQWQTADKKTR